MIHTLTFDAPNVPTSANVINKAHWSKARRLLSPWKDAAWGAWISQPRNLRLASALLSEPTEVKVLLPFKSQRRRDPHNYVSTNVKAIIDGLVMAGVWPDDTPEWVRVIEPELVIEPSGLVTVQLNGVK